MSSMWASEGRPWSSIGWVSWSILCKKTKIFQHSGFKQPIWFFIQFKLSINKQIWASGTNIYHITWLILRFLFALGTGNSLPPNPFIDRFSCSLYKAQSIFYERYKAESCFQKSIPRVIHLQSTVLSINLRLYAGKPESLTLKLSCRHLLFE